MKHHIAMVDAGAITPLGDGLNALAGLWQGKVAFSPAGKNRPYVAAHCEIPKRDGDLTWRRCMALALEATRGLTPRNDIKPARRALVFASTKGELDQWELLRAMRVAPQERGIVLSEMAFELAKRLGVGGRVLAVSTACASGASAVIAAAEMLEDGDCDEVLVIAADSLSLFIEHGFGALQAISKTGARPFDAARDGLTLGEAGAAVVLRRDSQGAKSAIVGWGSSNDANHISGPSRDGSGLAIAMERALDGLDKGKVVAICAHGTATRFNDAMEAHAFTRVFGEKVPPVFSIKGNIGHSCGAAALIELIVSATVANGSIPPTAGFEHQSPDEPPLNVIHLSQRLVPRGYVLSTNSGFGGINTALVISAAERA